MTEAAMRTPSSTNRPLTHGGWLTRRVNRHCGLAGVPNAARMVMWGYPFSGYCASSGGVSCSQLANTACASSMPMRFGAENSWMLT
mgnify:CR=1 FL=1